jgi:hypothetical protein
VPVVMDTETIIIRIAKLGRTFRLIVLEGLIFFEHLLYH